jgi:hypothetical protein
MQINLNGVYSARVPPCGKIAHARKGGGNMASAKTKKYLNCEKYQEIRQDLLDQLERNGTVGKYYTDLVEDYMSFWVDKCLLTDDIQSRGVVVTYNNGGGQSGKKRNDSIADKIKVNVQMLNILNALQIKPTQTEGDGDDPL